MSLGIRIHKSQGSNVIRILKERNKLDNTKKITQDGEDIIIPVNNKDILDIIKIPFNFEDYNFELQNNRPASLKEALRNYLPDIDEDVFQTSFDQIGDIAIIDIKEDLLPYSDKVGMALMESNPSIKTVYRKSTKVEGLLRIRGLELIAGTDDPLTIHKEHGIKINVDVKKAYFSPRLATEHNRIAKKIPENSLVLDMFASLAPFGLYLTKDKSIHVDSLDINPNVIELVEKSIQINKIKGNLNLICGDAKKFAQQSKNKIYDYIIMNHPSGAYSYLIEALNLVKSNGTIFYYDFMEIDNIEKTVMTKLQNFDIEIIDIHLVRQSSPTEYHVCVEIVKM